MSWNIIILTMSSFPSCWNETKIAWNEEHNLDSRGVLSVRSVMYVSFDCVEWDVYLTKYGTKISRKIKITLLQFLFIRLDVFHILYTWCSLEAVIPA